MQKIISYSYPNRIQLLANLDGFIVEYTNVYQRTIKIYKGVDNVLEFDIKNADQKRLDLITTPLVSNLKLNLMDASGNALPNSPYTVTPNSSLKGIATSVIPSADLDQFDEQYFTYSVTADDTDSNNIVLYADSRFGATGQVQLVGNATPATRKSVVYDRFSGEIDFSGNVKNHSSAIPTKFYEAVPTTSLSFSIDMTNYKGKIVVEATRDSTISVESFSRQGVELFTRTYTSANTGTLDTGPISIEDYNYFRVTWIYLDPTLIGLYNNPNPTGTVDKITVS